MNYAAIAGAIRNRDAETAVRLLVLTKQNPTSIESSLDELRRVCEDSLEVASCASPFAYFFDFT